MADALIKETLANLRAKYNLSDAYINLVSKDLEDLHEQPRDMQQQTIRALEKDIENSVSLTFTHNFAT